MVEMTSISHLVQICHELLVITIIYHLFLTNKGYFCRKSQGGGGGPGGQDPSWIRLCIVIHTDKMIIIDIKHFGIHHF